LGGEAAGGELPVPVDGAEHRAVVGAQRRQPGLQGAHRAGSRCRPIRNPHAPSLPFLVGLGAADVYDQARGIERQVGHVQAHQLGAAEGAGEANQQQSPVPHVQDPAGVEGREQRAQVRGGQRTLAGLRGAFAAADAGHQFADHEVGGGGFETRCLVRLGDGGDAPGQRADLGGLGEGG
jgi:hypothetical protein